MNRSLLLVVCDFLLLSILALARFDVPPDAVFAQDAEKIVSKEIVERISDGENYDDVVAELEATNETLEANLNSDKDDLEAQKRRLEEEIAARQLELQEKEDLIAQKDDVISENEDAIAAAAQAADKLEREKAEIERRREELQAQNAAAKREVELLAQNLGDAKKKADELAAQKAKTESEAAAARVELAKAEEQARARAEAIAKAENALENERERADALAKTTDNLARTAAERIDTLAQATDKTATRLDSLNTGLSEVGTNLKTVGEGLAGVGEKINSVTEEVSGVKDTVAGVREEVQDVRVTVTNVSEEVAGVGDKVQNVTERVADIDQTVAETAAEQRQTLDQITERQAKSINEIYTNYEKNRVKLTMTYRHKGGFLGKEKDDVFETDTIILQDGSFVYSLVHVRNSPFRLEPAPRKLTSVTGTITGKGIEKPIPVGQVAFMDDPRILIFPIYEKPESLREKYGLQLFSTPKNPHMFAEAFVVDTDKRNFCQTEFTRDGNDGRYIRVRHNKFTFFTGKFNPGKTDLVFTKSGDVLGVMVNNDYAFHVQNLGSRIRRDSHTHLGSSFNAPKTTGLLADLGKSLSRLQLKFR